MTQFDENGNLQINTLLENMEEYQDKYELTFGKVDISPTSGLGSDLAITSEMKKKADEFTQHALSQNSPYEAINEGLEHLCFLRGITKKINEHSIVLLKFVGPDGTVIPKATEVKNSITDELFGTNEKGIIENGVFTVYATALNPGRIICKTNTLDSFTPSIEGVTVVNSNDGILGYLKESDTDLRKRLLSYSNGLNIDEELYLKILNIQNVKLCNIISNPELYIDSNGIDPKSTSIVILGGENKSIAQAIFEIIPADKKTVGTIQEFISSSVSGKEYPINFSRPKSKAVTMYIEIIKNSDFDSDNIGAITESILKYFEDKFTISNDVFIDSLYIPAQQDYNNNYLSFSGIKNCVIKLNNAFENIPIAYNEFPTLALEDLTLVIVEG